MTNQISILELNSKVEDLFLKATPQYRLAFRDALINSATLMGANIKIDNGKVVIENERYLPPQMAENLRSLEKMIIAKLQPIKATTQPDQLKESDTIDEYDDDDDFIWVGIPKKKKRKPPREKPLVRVSVSVTKDGVKSNIIMLPEDLLRLASIDVDGRVKIGRIKTGDKLILGITQVIEGGYKLSKDGEGRRKIQFGSTGDYLFDGRYAANANMILPTSRPGRIRCELQELQN